MLDSCENQRVKRQFIDSSFKNILSAYQTIIRDFLSLEKYVDRDQGRLLNQGGLISLKNEENRKYNLPL